MRTTFWGLSLIAGMALERSLTHAFAFPSSGRRVVVQAAANHPGHDFQHQQRRNSMATTSTFIPSGGRPVLESRLDSSHSSSSHNVAGGITTTRMACSPLGLGEQNSSCCSMIVVLSAVAFMFLSSPSPSGELYYNSINSRVWQHVRFECTHTTLFVRLFLGAILAVRSDSPWYWGFQEAKQKYQTQLHPTIVL